MIVLNHNPNTNVELARMQVTSCWVCMVESLGLKLLCMHDDKLSLKYFQL